MCVFVLLLLTAPPLFASLHRSLRFTHQQLSPIAGEKCRLLS